MIEMFGSDKRSSLLLCKRKKAGNHYQPHLMFDGSTAVVQLKQQKLDKT
jgi:hypothetical protein